MSTMSTCQNGNVDGDKSVRKERETILSKSGAVNNNKVMPSSDRIPKADNQFVSGSETPLNNTDEPQKKTLTSVSGNTENSTKLEHNCVHSSGIKPQQRLSFGIDNILRHNNNGNCLSKTNSKTDDSLFSNNRFSVTNERISKSENVTLGHSTDSDDDYDDDDGDHWKGYYDRLKPEVDKRICPDEYLLGNHLNMWTIRDLQKDRFGVRRVGHPYQNRTPPKRKKPRTSFTRLQIIELERRFEQQKYLASSERSNMAKSLKMSDSQVKTWFQNRRTKWRRQSAEEKELERQAANRLLMSLSRCPPSKSIMLSPLS